MSKDYYLEDICNVDNIIYLFCRENGKKQIYRDNNYFPSLYILDENGEYNSFDNKKLKRIYFDSIKEKKDYKSNKIYQSDLHYCKEYLIYKVNNILPSRPRICFFDIENIPVKGVPVGESFTNPTGAITCITAYDSYTEQYTTWWIEEQLGNNYEEKEKHLINNFVNYIKELDFTMISAHNCTYDYNYLYMRTKRIFGKKYNFANEISPINEKRFGRVECDIPIYYPCGLSVVDFKGLYEKLTLNKKASYALNYLAQEDLGMEDWGETDFDEISEHVKEKNKQDVLKLVELNKKFNVIDYFDKMRIKAKVLWEDLPQEGMKPKIRSKNSRIVDQVVWQIAREKNIILPNAPKKDEDYIIPDEDKKQGAIRNVLKTGASFDVGAVDLTSAYPTASLDFSLSPENVISYDKFILNKNNIKIDITDRDDFNKIIKTVYFKRNPDAIIPSAIRKLATTKNDLKAKLADMSNNDENYRNTQLEYDSTKGILNSCFGVFGEKHFRFYNLDCFNSITSIVRNELFFGMNKIKEWGYNIISFDTDSIFYNSKEDLSDRLNECMKEFGKPYDIDISVKYDFEGYFSRIFINGNCLEGSSRIITDKGNIPIRTIYTNKDLYKVQTVNLKTNTIEFKNIKRVWKTPLSNRTVYKINVDYLSQLNSGVKLTEDHPILTKNGWKRVDKLLKDDLINTGVHIPNSIQRQILIGTFLGDSTIQDGRFIFAHSFKQKDYCDYKAKVINMRHSYNGRITKQGFSKAQYDFNMHPYFKYLKNIGYKEKKNITEDLLKDFSIISLAFLFMDDGYIKKTQYCGELAVCNFDYDGVVLLSNKIKEFGIDNKIVITQGKYYRIYFNSANVKKLCEIMAPYIHESMNYKLYPEYRDIPKINLFEMQSNEPKEFFYAPYKKTIFKTNKEVYDIEVYKNHNFVTLGGVVHNCRYYGYQVKNGVEQSKPKVKGLEIKRNSSTKYEKYFQKELLEKVLSHEDIENIIEWIWQEKRRIRTLDLKELAFPVKISEREYTVDTISMRALRNSKSLKPEFNIDKGDLFFYIPIVPIGKDRNLKPIDILAFKKEYEFDLPVDYNAIIEKSILRKAETIFENIDKTLIPKLHRRCL